jgi:hypothetical protein
VRRIAVDHRDRSSQFPTIIPEALSTKGTEQLMRVRLEDHGPRTNHFPSLTPGVTWSAYHPKPAMGSR